MLIRYFFIVVFTFINLYLLKRVFLEFNKKFNYLKGFIIFFIFISITTYIYKYSISNHMEFNLKMSRAIFIFSEIIYLLMFISLSLSLVYLKVYSLIKKKQNIKLNKSSDINNSSKEEAKINGDKITRKDFIKQGALIFPLSSVLLTSKGVYEASSSPLFIDIKLNYSNLPKSMNGLKIAQISDLHLGGFISIDYLKNIIKKLNKLNLDLVLVTGDFIDEYSLLDEGVKVLSKAKTKYGIYSSAGNHEYSRGMSPVLRAFKKYKIPYLISKGKRIKVEDDYLFIGGVDDTHAVSRKFKKGYLKKSLKKTIKYSKKDDFKILMSHRYKVFPHSIANNIDLTLSGHSHGSQIGFNRRSIFEGVKKHKYLWGKYQDKGSVLYVTSGAGHWFPFRLNCPTEVPIFTLHD